jgi:hypothetical protein
VFEPLLATGAVKPGVVRQRVLRQAAPGAVFVVLHGAPLLQAEHSGPAESANRSLVAKRFSELGSARLLAPCSPIRRQQLVVLSS